MTDTNLRFHGAAPFRVAAIHGGPGAAGEMAPVARRLSRNAGVLDPLQTARSIEGQIEGLREVLARHAQTPAVLIGYSWGAWLSLLTAARHPESIEYEAAVTALSDPAIPVPLSDANLEKLGRLAAKADAYAPAAETNEPGGVRVSAEIYRAVWKEAAALRQSGELLRRARMTRCPVVAIHGDSDSSPAAGVTDALSALPEFRLTILAKCGHTPWLEHYAKEEFYSILFAEIG